MNKTGPSFLRSLTMIGGKANTWLAVTVFICGGLALAANADIRLLGPKFQLFGPLAALLIAGAAWISRSRHESVAMAWVMSGLIIAALADFGLMVRDGFIWAILGYAAVHTCYLLAFCHWAQFLKKKWPLLVCWAAIGVPIILIIDHFPPSLMVMLGIYALLITAMCAQAISVWSVRINDPDMWRYRLAAVGAMMFLVSDTLIILGISGITIPLGSLFVTLLFGVAQWCIGSSIVKRCSI